MEIPKYEKEEFWGVCVGEGKDAEIVKVYSDHDVALEESVMWTLETGVQHTAKKVYKKSNK